MARPAAELILVTYRDEAMLVQAWQRGDQPAADELGRRYVDVVVGYALRWVWDKYLGRGVRRDRFSVYQEARDISQEAWCRAITSLPGFRGDCSVGTWLYPMVRSAHFDLIRQESRRRELSLSDDKAFWVAEHAERRVERHRTRRRRPTRARPAGWFRHDTPEHFLMARELFQHIRAVVELLPTQERRVFLLRHDHGLRLETIAGFLGLEEKSARNLHHLAKLRMRPVLADFRSYLWRPIRWRSRWLKRRPTPWPFHGRRYPGITKPRTIAGWAPRFLDALIESLYPVHPWPPDWRNRLRQALNVVEPRRLDRRVSVTKQLFPWPSAKALEREEKWLARKRRKRPRRIRGAIVDFHFNGATYQIDTSDPTHTRVYNRHVELAAIRAQEIVRLW